MYLITPPVPEGQQPADALEAIDAVRRLPA